MKQRYFTIDLHTYPEEEVKKFLQYKKLDKKGLKYFHKTEFKYKRIDLLRRKANKEKLTKVLQINPKLIEYFI